MTGSGTSRRTMQNQISFQREPSPSPQVVPSRYESLDGRLQTIISYLADDSRSTRVLAVVILFSLLFSAGIALTRRPFCDEAWFADAPYNLLHHGFLGMKVLDPHGFPFSTYVEGIDRYTYWIMPGYLLMQAAWYKVVGLTLFSMRSISIFWGGVALLSWFVVVRWLTGDTRIALLATFLFGTEHNFARSAANGRMDIMCAALGLASLALYIRLRENFTLALFVAGCVSAINLFTHPNAIFGMIALAVIVLYFDRNRLTIRAVLFAFSPFLVLGSLWGLYIAQAPHLFLAQFQAQATIPHRLEVPWNPLKALVLEMVFRYGPPYGLTFRPPMAFAAFILSLYFAAFITALAVPQLRRQSGVRILLILTAVSFVLLMCLQKNWYYLIFILPYYTALLAIIAGWLWPQSFSCRVAVIALLGITTILHLAIIGGRIAHDDYRTRYLEATNFIKQSAKPGDLVMGSGELAFELGFEGQVLDDSRLGFLSGKRPEFIAIEGQYALYWIPWFADHEPDTYRYIQELFAYDYDVVLDQTKDRYTTYGISDRPYQVLKRKTASSP